MNELAGFYQHIKGIDCGIMVGANGLSLGGRWFEPWLNRTKDFKNGTCCLERAASLLDG